MGLLDSTRDIDSGDLPMKMAPCGAFSFDGLEGVFQIMGCKARRYWASRVGIAEKSPRKSPVLRTQRNWVDSSRTGNILHHREIGSRCIK